MPLLFSLLYHNSISFTIHFYIVRSTPFLFLILIPANEKKTLRKAEPSFCFSEFQFLLR